MSSSDPDNLNAILANINEDCVELLLSRGVNVHARGRHGLTAIHIAVQKGCTRMVEILLNYGANPNSRYPPGAYSLLHEAVEKGNVAIVNLLLKYGAKVNTVVKGCRHRREHASTLSMERRGITPLMMAAGLGDIEVMEALLAAGARVEAEITDRRTALIVAAERGQPEALRMLLDHGANLEAKGENGLTALHIAARNGHTKVHEFYPPRYGKDTHATPYPASNTGHFEIVKLLVERGADIDSQDPRGATTLHHAVERGSVRCVAYCINSGAAVDTPDHCGRTPLHVAIEVNRLKVAKLLIDSGSQVNVAVVDTGTPLYGYISHRLPMPEMVQLLLEHGARTDHRIFVTASRGFDSPKGPDINILKILLESGSADEKWTGKTSVCALIHQLNRPPAVERNQYGLVTHPDWIECADIVMQHVVRMEVLGVYDTEVELGVLAYDQSTVNAFREKCKEEVEKMQSESPSFYDILKMDIEDLANMAKNEEVVDQLESETLCQRFPIYGKIILSQFQKGVLRMRLLQRAAERYHTTIPVFSSLPYEIVERIFEFLSNEDLRKVSVLFRARSAPKCPPPCSPGPSTLSKSENKS